MSIFAMNYLNDISEYDQSLVNFNEKQINRLKRKSQKARSSNRMIKHQTFVQQKAELTKNTITDTQNKIIEDAVNHSDPEKDDLSSQFIKVYESKFNKKPFLENQNENENFDVQETGNYRNFIKEDKKLDPKEEIYYRIIKKRDDKMKNIEKRDYFFDYSGV